MSGVQGLRAAHGENRIRLRPSGDDIQIEGMTVKVVGTRNASWQSPEQCVLRACRLLAAARQLSPVARGAGFVFRAKTRDEFEAWKRRQPDPRYW